MRGFSCGAALDASVVHAMADSDGSVVRNVPFTTNMSSAAASYVQASKFLFWLYSNVRARTSASFSMGFCVFTRLCVTPMGTLAQHANRNTCTFNLSNLLGCLVGFWLCSCCLRLNLISCNKKEADTLIPSKVAG